MCIEKTSSKPFRGHARSVKVHSVSYQASSAIHMSSACVLREGFCNALSTTGPLVHFLVSSCALCLRAKSGPSLQRCSSCFASCFHKCVDGTQQLPSMCSCCTTTRICTSSPTSSSVSPDGHTIITTIIATGSNSSKVMLSSVAPSPPQPSHSQELAEHHHHYPTSSSGSTTTTTTIIITTTTTTTTTIIIIIIIVISVLSPSPSPSQHHHHHHHHHHHGHLPQHQAQHQHYRSFVVFTSGTAVLALLVHIASFLWASTSSWSGLL